MSRAKVRFYRENSTTWTILYYLYEHVEVLYEMSGVKDAATRKQIVVSAVNDGVGPGASVRGREDALRVLTQGSKGAFLVGLVVTLVLAALTALFYGKPAFFPVALLGGAIVFPIGGLMFPFAVRWTRAQHQLKGWKKRGAPEGERPINGSLPGILDAIIGLSIGGYFSVFFIYELFWG